MPDGSTRNNPVKGSLRKDLTAGHLEGAAFGGMVGLGETYFPAFALALGLGEITAGLVASVPLLAGGIMQMISPLAIRKFKSYKRWVLFCTFVQACSFVPMIIFAASGRVSGMGILLVAAIYWGGGLAAGPSWNTWMGGLVPRNVRSRFFANRTRTSQLTLLIGLVAGGCLLQLAAGQDTIRLAFLGIFVAAGTCRLISVGMLTRQTEPSGLRKNIVHIPVRTIWKQMHNSGIRRLLLYLVLVQGAVQISGPFFTPFMFQKLHFSYAQYVTLVATAFLSKVVMLPTWGRLAHRLGALRLLWLGGVGIVPLPIMWILSEHYGWLLCSQVFAGVFWGAYELGFFLLFFDSIPEKERTGVLTLYNLGNSIMWTLGAAIGGMLLYSLGTSHTGYMLLFGISTTCRVLALPLLRGVPSTADRRHSVAVQAVEGEPVAIPADASVLPILLDQASDEPLDKLHINTIISCSISNNSRQPLQAPTEAA